MEPKIIAYPFGDKTYTSALYYGQDNRVTLSELPEKSVQCVVTSPPYWGLRDYGTAKWEGGDPNCNHEPPEGAQWTEWYDNNRQQAAAKMAWYKKDGSCRCGAVRVDSQIGLEMTPDEYVASMVEVFRGVWRVLRDDGTLWLNLGDSYAGGGRNAGNPLENTSKLQRGNIHSMVSGPRPVPLGLKAKDLVGIPWKVAFALQADGWYLRSDIIWAKGSCMPENIYDRPTKSHEYLFLLAKSREYYYDQDAIREPYGSAQEHQKRKVLYASHGDGETSRGRGDGHNVLGDLDSGRNKRSVWHINPKPYSGAHFATYPPKLIEPCVLAGTKPGDTVLDPFSGSGTTGYVANRLRRNYVGTDLNPDYLPLAEKRILGLDPEVEDDKDDTETVDVLGMFKE